MLKKILCQVLDNMNKSLKISLSVHIAIIFIIGVSGLVHFNKTIKVEKRYEEIQKDYNIVESFTITEEFIEQEKERIKQEENYNLGTKAVLKNKNSINNKIQELLNKKKKAEQLQRVKEEKERIKQEEIAKKAKIEAMKKLNEKIKIQERNKKITEVVKKFTTDDIRKDLLRKREEQKRKEELERKRRNLEEIRRLNKISEQRRKEQFKIDQIDYVLSIKNKIMGNWIQDYGLVGWSCEVKVIQNKRGYVENYYLRDCDGNDRFKQSIVEAIKVSQPLPLPKKEELFDPVLNFTFIVE